jgi:hypothetical protein
LAQVTDASLSLCWMGIGLAQVTDASLSLCWVGIGLAQVSTDTLPRSGLAPTVALSLLGWYR